MVRIPKRDKLSKQLCAFFGSLICILFIRVLLQKVTLLICDLEYFDDLTNLKGLFLFSSV